MRFIQQQKLLASVISFPQEDLFVVYRGVNELGEFAMDVRVNPLISLVWVGFFLLMAGTAISTFGRRGASRKATDSKEVIAENAEVLASKKESKASVAEKEVSSAQPANASSKEV